MRDCCRKQNNTMDHFPSAVIEFARTKGCPLGDNCRFLHYVPQTTNLEPQNSQSSKKTQTSNSVGGSSGREDQREGCVSSSFCASVTANIILGASLTNAKTGTDGYRTKQIYRETGVKLSIVDHERDPNLKNGEIKRNYDQISEASGMVRGLIQMFGSDAAHPDPVSPYKSELCEKFSAGKCKYGGRCHFAHGVAELR